LRGSTRAFSHTHTLSLPHILSSIFSALFFYLSSLSFSLLSPSLPSLCFLCSPLFAWCLYMYVCRRMTIVGVRERPFAVARPCPLPAPAAPPSPLFIAFIFFRASFGPLLFPASGPLQPPSPGWLPLFVCYCVGVVSVLRSAGPHCSSCQSVWLSKLAVISRESNG
jgi:hypothetical protein